MRARVQVGYNIGWAFEWEVRRRRLSHAAMPTLGGLNYAAAMKHLWGTAVDAYRMEQAVLLRFNEARHADNHEVVTNVARAELAIAWAQCMSEVCRLAK